MSSSEETPVAEVFATTTISGHSGNLEVNAEDLLPDEEIVFDEAGELEFVEAINNITANYHLDGSDFQLSEDDDQAEGDSADDSDIIVIRFPNDVSTAEPDDVDGMPEESCLVGQSTQTDSQYDPCPFHEITGGPASQRLQKTILQDNLQFVCRMREGIQKMRDLRSRDCLSWEAQRRIVCRLSVSCPCLACNTHDDPWDVYFAPWSRTLGGRKSSLEDVRVLGFVDDGRRCHAKETYSLELFADSADMLGKAQSAVKIFINDRTVSSQENLDVAGHSSTVADPDGATTEGGASADRVGSEGLDVAGEPCGGGGNDGSPWRRRSWLGLDQDDGGSSGSQKSKIKRNLARTQRSMSLSSLDSDEDAFYDAHESLSHTSASSAMAIVDLVESSSSSSSSSKSRREKPRSFSGGSSSSCVQHSTDGCISKHSLSSTQLQSGHEMDDRRTSVGELCRLPSNKPTDDHCLLLPRSPLQKSISTPSILAVKDSAEATVPVQAIKVRTSPLTLDGDDSPVLSKPKKRGSLFFKKKKGKDKDKENKKGSGSGATSSHHFVSVCYSNSTVCHVCNKSMANKAALRCENCLVNVHEHSCKDQISNCTQFRGPIKINMRPTLPQQSWQLQVPKDRPPLIAPIKPTTSGPTASPLPIGKENRKQNGGTPPKQTPTSSPSPNIPSVSSPSTTRRGYIPSGYSQWRRVATKLGVNKVINEEKEADGDDGLTNNIVDINSASMESLDEGAAELVIMDDDPELRLPEEEPEAWSSTVDKKILKKLKEKDIKKQEIIYELIITEKHHCLTLKVMQKLFAQGMNRELGMTAEMVDKIFPKLEDIIEVHMTFLKRLQEKQKKEPIIDSISDILLQQFQGEMATMMKDAYGAFCSRHKEALSLYKDIYKQDRKFQTFIKNRSALPLCKARGIPECILLVTQRITKYPLLIESLIKAFKDNKVEQQNLMLANSLVKDILSNVNFQVAEKEKEQRLLQIYNKIDAKSATIYKGKKFKKSDLLSNNRRLRHEATVGLRQARGKEIEVTVVVLSDVIFFLQENNQKYSFVTHDNKAGVISLQKLLVREKAGQDNRGIYLISSHPNDPEMYELVFSSPKEKKAWMEGIRQAVDLCPEEDEGVPSETEEERKVMEAKSARLRELTTNLHEKDKELAVICEEKMRILGEMMEVVGKEEVMEPVQYLQLVEDPHEGSDARDMLLAAVQEASRLASTLYVSGTNLSRSISSAGEHQSEAYISPILPKRAETFGGFDNPNKDMLPKPVIIKKKHLDTAREADPWVTGFGGLLNKNDQLTSSASDLDSKESDTLLSVKSKEVRRASGPLPYRESLSPSSPEKSALRRSTLSAGFLPLPLKCDDNHLGSAGSIEGDKDSSREMLNLPTPPLVTIGREQWTNTIQLSHYLNTLMCVFSQHFTSVEILKAELTKAYEEISRLNKECGRESRDKKSLYRPNQQLEELRNLQEQLTQERTLWQKERDAQERNLEEKREELLRLQESLKNEKEDVEQQREFLYRQLDALQRKGIILSPSLSVVSTSSHGSAESSSSSAEKSTLSPPAACSAEALGLVSPSAHRRSMSCDLQLPPNKEAANRAGASGGSCSATSSPTQTMEMTKPKVELKQRSSASNLASLLPINLYSATNQQKASQGLPVKQQLPLKLASGAGSKHGGAAGDNNSAPNRQYPSSLGSVTANVSGLAHVLSTSPHLRASGGHPNGSGPQLRNQHHAGSLASPPSGSAQPQSYLHGHAAQWSNPASYGSYDVVGASKPPPSDGNSKNKDRYKRSRDPDKNEEIIYF